MAEENLTCYCPCCREGVEAPHEYHLERRTMPPMEGTWTLTAPNGRTWQASMPIRCVQAEMNDRIPPEVQLARIKGEAL